MSRQEAYWQYTEAVKMGKRYHRKRLFRAPRPQMQSLDTLLDPAAIAGKQDLGVIEIPLERVAGTKEAGRCAAFAGNFMPLLHPSTEFANKWISVCETLFRENGELEPIECCEYMGKFFVSEGNKRVSVLKSLGLETIRAHVVRLVPRWSQAAGIQLYYEFLQAYDCCGLYEMEVTQPGGFEKMQKAMGFERTHVWTEEERRCYLARLHFFREVYEQAGGTALSLTAADALLVWLSKYPYGDLQRLSRRELRNSLRSVWVQLQMKDLQNRIRKGTAPLRELKKWTGIRSAELRMGSVSCADRKRR